MDFTKLLPENMEKPPSEEMIREACAAVAPVDLNAPAVLEFTESLREFSLDFAAFGAMGEMMHRYIAATGLPYLAKEPLTCIFCADHGVAEENVSAYPLETTLDMTMNYVISKGAAANAFSDLLGSDMLVADMGIKGDTSGLPALLQMKIAHGTKNSAQGPAMTREESIKALCYGIFIGSQMAEDHHTIMIPGEMGISNTTASAAITAALCDLSAEKATGRGTNISDARLKVKIATVKKILAVNKPNPADPIDVLAKVGGFELGAIAGLMLGAASRRAVTFLDGFNTGAAALIATALCPQVRDYLLPSHLGGEQGQPHILRKLGLKPIMNLDIKLGEGIGSTLAADILAKLLAGCYRLHSLSEELKQKLLNRVEITTISPDHVTLTDKTFDFYTKTMPPLDKICMAKCQERWDNLTKPINSLGLMEKIAVQISGVLGDELPSGDTNIALLLLGIKDMAHAGQGDKANDPFTVPQSVLLSTFADGILPDSNITIGNVTLGHSQVEAFEFGRCEGERLAFSNGILGLGMTDVNFAVLENIAAKLLCPDGSLRFETTNFLAALEGDEQLLASAALGAMVAAAHNDSIVVLGDPATVAVASYAVQMLPDMKDFLLPTEPQLYQLNIKIPGLTTLAGMGLAAYSLRVLNDMKTFAEAQVAVANDGPGKGRQVGV